MKSKKKKKKKKKERIFGERQGVRRYIVVVQPTAITKKNQCKKESLLHWSYKCCYISHIVAFSSTVAVVPAQNDVFIAVAYRSAAISKLPLLKHIYWGGFMSHHCRTLQKTIPIATVLKNAAIDPTYSDSPKKGRNRWHIAAVLQPLQKNRCNNTDFLYCKTIF